MGAAPGPTTFTVGALALTKTAGGVVDVDGNGTTAGDTIGYSFTVTNNSNVIVTDVAVDDPLLGGVIGCGAGPLAPGTSLTCGPVTYVLTESDLGAALVNTATASASADGITLSAMAAVQTPIPPACSAVPTTTTEPPTNEQLLAVAEPPTTNEPPASSVELPDSTVAPPETPDSTIDEPESTLELPDSTIEQPTSTVEVPEPTVDSSVAVTESSDVAAPFGFCRCPGAGRSVPAATRDERGPDVDHTAAAEHRTSGSDRAAGSHHQCGCQRWRWTWRDRFSARHGLRHIDRHSGRRRIARQRSRPRRRMAPTRRTALIDGLTSSPTPISPSPHLGAIHPIQRLGAFRLHRPDDPHPDSALGATAERRPERRTPRPRRFGKIAAKLVVGKEFVRTVGAIFTDDSTRQGAADADDRRPDHRR